MMKRIFCIICAMAIATCGLAMPAYAATAYAATSIAYCNSEQLANIRQAMATINSMVIEPDKEFSFNSSVGPRSVKAGYVKAADGAGDKIQGGGVAQLASTIYLAIKERTDYDVTELYTYAEKYNAPYVESGDDAVFINYSDEQDFKFKNRTGVDVTLHIWIDAPSSELRCSLTEGDTRSSSAVGVLNSAKTKISGNDAKLTNIKLACEAIDGTDIKSGQEFSFNDIVGPRNESSGYEIALNGRGVKVRGGGVAQVATTIYLAVKDLEDVTLTHKHTYGANFSDDYVTDVADAIVTDYAAGTDFGFKYTGDGSMQLGLSVDDSELECTVTLLS